jgi:hypothetical protein
LTPPPATLASAAARPADATAATASRTSR